MKKKRYVLHSYFPTHCYAHGDYDFEHYQVTYYDMIKKIKIIKDNFCEAGVCDTLPFRFGEEAELFDSMNLIDYWRHCRVPEELIQQAIKKSEKE